MRAVGVLLHLADSERFGVKKSGFKYIRKAYRSKHLEGRDALVLFYVLTQGTEASFLLPNREF